MIPQAYKPWRAGRAGYAHGRSQRGAGRWGGRRSGNFPQQLVQHGIEEILAGIAGYAPYLLLVLGQNEGRRGAYGACQCHTGLGLIADEDAPQGSALALRRQPVGLADIGIPFNVRGPWAKPSFVPDASGVAKSVIDKLKRGAASPADFLADPGGALKSILGGN